MRTLIGFCLVIMFLSVSAPSTAQQMHYTDTHGNVVVPCNPAVTTEKIIETVVALSSDAEKDFGLLQSSTETQVAKIIFNEQDQSMVSVPTIQLASNICNIVNNQCVTGTGCDSDHRCSFYYNNNIRYCGCVTR